MERTDAHRWTPEEVDKLRRMLNTGIKPAKIAEALGLPPTVIYSKIKALKKEATDEGKSTPPIKSAEPAPAPAKKEYSTPEISVSDTEKLAEENAMLRKQINNLHNEVLELRKKDRSVDYVKRINQLNDTIEEKEQIIREKTADVNKWFKKAQATENLANQLQTSLDAAKTEIEEWKRKVEVLEKLQEQPTTSDLPAPVVEGTLVSGQEYYISTAEAAMLEELLTTILNDLGCSSCNTKIYNRIFGSEEPAAGNILLMASVLEALPNISKDE